MVLDNVLNIFQDMEIIKTLIQKFVMMIEQEKILKNMI